MPFHDLGLLRYSPFVSPQTSLMQNGGSSIFFTAEPCIIIFKNKNAEYFGKRQKEYTNMLLKLLQAVHFQTP
jgi:hypothetical protein